MTSLYVLLMMVAQAGPAPELPPTEPFEAPKYGVATRIPKDWTIAQREAEDRVFVAVIPQQELDRPGVAACELALRRRAWTTIARGSTPTPSGTAGPTASSPPTESSRTPGAIGSSRSGNSTRTRAASGER